MTNFRTKLIVSLVLFVTLVNAERFNNTQEADATFLKTSQDDSNTSVADVGTSRIKHHLPLYGGTAILGLGGLHALAVLYAIKVKVIIVAFVIALSIYYYSKIYLKGCHQYREIIRDTNPYESFASYGTSGYSNSLPAGIGYPGTDRFNALSTAPDDHDHHLHDDNYHHLHDDNDHHLHDDNNHHLHDDNDHNLHDDSDHHSHEPVPKILETETRSSPPATDKSETVRRVYNQMRQFSSPLFDNIDWSDMGFQLLGLDSDDCRRRFTCELDFRVKQIPFSNYIFDSDGPAFLSKYRESDDDVNKATAFSDCAMFYGECKYS